MHMHCTHTNTHAQMQSPHANTHMPTQTHAYDLSNKQLVARERKTSQQLPISAFFFHRLLLSTFIASLIILLLWQGQFNHFLVCESNCLLEATDLVFWVWCLWPFLITGALDVHLPAPIREFRPAVDPHFPFSLKFAELPHCWEFDTFCELCMCAYVHVCMWGWCVEFI